MPLRTYVDKLAGAIVYRGATLLFSLAPYRCLPLVSGSQASICSKVTISQNRLK